MIKARAKKQTYVQVWMAKQERRMRQRLLLCIASCILAIAPAQASENPRPFIIVAEVLPPYEYMNDAGKPTGINVEIIDHVFNALGVPYEIRFYPWSRAWLMAANGAADAVLSVSYQKQREPYLYYTDEQRTFWKTGEIPPDFLWLTEYVFFATQILADAVRFESYEQLQADKLRIAISDQYTYDTALLEANIPQVVKNTPLDAIQALLRGEADLSPMDRTVGWALLKEHDLHDRITWLPKPLFMKPYLLGFSKNANYPDIEDLMQRFYGELRNMRQNGTVEEITARYLDPIRPPRPDRKILFVGEEWRPFEYEENGQMQGLNIKTVSRIMKSLQIPYEIRSYPWPRAWLMAEQGHADAVLSVSYHPEREDTLFYTDAQRQAAREGTLPTDYLWISHYAFFTKGNHTNLTSDYDAIIQSNARVGLNNGYSYTKSFPAEEFSSRMYFNTEAGFMGLLTEEIDLYPMDLTVGEFTLKNMGLEQSIRPLPEILFSKAYLIPFVKKSDYPGLESIMYEFYHQLRQLRASGALDP